MVLRAANQNYNNCRWQLYHNVAHTGVAPSGDSPPGHNPFLSFPTWLPLWGSWRRNRLRGENRPLRLRHLSHRERQVALIDAVLQSLSQKSEIFASSLYTREPGTALPCRMRALPLPMGEVPEAKRAFLPSQSLRDSSPRVGAKGAGGAPAPVRWLTSSSWNTGYTRRQWLPDRRKIPRNSSRRAGWRSPENGISWTFGCR